MTIKNTFLSALCALSFVTPALSATIDGGTQTNVFSPGGILNFDFLSVPTANGDVTVTLNASGDLAFDLNETISVGIGAVAGTLTPLGTVFTSFDAGLGDVSFNCAVLCTTGTRTFSVGQALFNSFGSDVRVQLTLGSGVNDFEPNGAQVLLEVPDAAQVPLPAAGWLLIAGLGGLAVMRRRAT